MHSLILFIFMVLPVAVPSCDPLTQYENEAGQCCKMCGPGTRMIIGDHASSNCQDPLCMDCKDDEYQEGYTKEKICALHAYCDNNKNKESAGRSMTSKGICRCKTGYHCTSEDCITCELHTFCNEGYRIQFRGNHTHNTVCQKCPPNTFSSGTSEECESEKVPTEQQHVKWIVPLISVLFFFIVIGIIIYKSRAAKAKVKGCVESCLHGAEAKPETNPTDDQDPHELLSVERETQPEDTKTEPEENVEDQHNEQLSQSLISNEVAVTEKGNMVVQEDGKSELLSRQESQTQESINSF